MEERRPWGQMIPTRDGNYVQLYEDGSVTVYDPYMNVVSDDPTPNPQRAAIARAGREDDAADDALTGRVSQENTRRWQSDFDQRATASKQSYDVAMMNARTNADQARASAKYQQEQLALARERLAFDRETQAQNLGLNQARLGYDLVNTGAQYKQNPRDYFLEADWARGVAGNPQTSTFLSALQNNTRMAGFGARGQVAEPASLDSLYTKLGGGGQATAGGAGVSDDERQNNYLAQIGNVAAKGAHQLGPGTLEQLTPTERSLFTAGLKNLGYDPDTFLTQHRRSRFAQGFGSRGAA